MKNATDRNAALYNALNDIDDRRERLIKASSTGRHEPTSAFGGLYDVEEVDDGGRLIERRERGIAPAFVPVAELDGSSNIDDIAPTGKKPADPAAPTVSSRDGRVPFVHLRRGGMTFRLSLKW